MLKKIPQISLFACLVLSFSSSLNATLLDDIAYTSLLSEMGGATPNGAGVAVSLVEAHTSPPAPAAACSETNLSACRYLPDTAVKTYTDQSTGLGLSSDFSSHATGSANRFYGASSVASGITDINVFSANHWLTSGYLNTGTSVAPVVSMTRVSNHSYVGSTASSDLELLQRIDFIAEQDEHSVVVALNNGSTNQPLNSSAYNVISVGRTDANHPTGTVSVNSNPGGVYNPTNRNGPDLVVPESTTSGATPHVASAAALLVGYGHDQGLTKSSGSVTNRNGDTIFHAETSEVIKASLMAGASRSTANTASAANITDYRSATNQTSNGLDTRYGAGQLNVHNSLNIIQAGEQAAGLVASTGFDYDDAFGGAEGSNNEALYEFVITDLSTFAASLVWNVSFDVEADEEFTSAVAQLFDLNLALSIFNGTEFESLLSSTSTVDNTENIWSQLSAGTYRLEVSANGTFNHDYGLAWQTSPVPVPAAVWLFLSAISGLFFSRRKST